MTTDFICVSCQKSINPKTELVRLDGGDLIPVCRPCWDAVPVASRIALADRMRHTKHSRDVMDSVRLAADSIDRMIQRSFHGDDDDPLGMDSGSIGPLFGVDDADDNDAMESYR